MLASHLFRTCRPHQWAKNLLLITPLLLGHELGNIDKLIDLGLAIIAFSLVCSTGYVINDLIDAKIDSANPERKTRPIAAGLVSKTQAWILAGACLVLALALDTIFELNLIFLALGYLVLSISYSLWFKRLLLVDVFFLGFFYTMRIFIGGAVVDLAISFWLLCFAVFFFIGLGFLKRYAELKHSKKLQSDSTLAGRSYQVEDLQMCAIMGIAASFVAILVHALYIDSEVSAAQYNTPELIWLQLPVLLYWICRMWILANRNQMRIDPVLFATRDPVSIAAGFLCIGFAVAAKF